MRVRIRDTDGPGDEVKSQPSIQQCSRFAHKNEKPLLPQDNCERLSPSYHGTQQ